MKSMDQQTVLVTGVTGFLGSHLAQRLVEIGHRVIGLKRSSSKLDRIQAVRSHLLLYDIDQMEQEQLFQQAGPIDAVIHTATCYGRRQESPYQVFAANTAFPFQLLELASRCGTQVFLNADTSLDQRLNSYALSKAQFRQWGEQLAQQGKIRFVNLQLEHFFGPGDDLSKFTTYVIQSCLANKAQLDLTAGEQQRDFIYIDDVVSAFLAILQQSDQIREFYTTYEVGSGKAVSIREFVETVHQITQSSTALKFGVLPYRNHEAMYSVADIHPLQALGWSPQYSLDQALRQTIANFQA